jgi:hypothetical protein
MWLTGHVAGMLAIRSAHKILSGKPEGKKPGYWTLDVIMLLKLILEE